jgi:outer membrane immunogenic protein
VLYNLGAFFLYIRGRMMKSAFLIIAAAAALIGTPALAADMAVKAPPLPVPTWGWTGFYVGGNLGYGWNDPTVSESPGDPLTSFEYTPGHSIVDPASTSFDTRGWLGGIQAGYNWQFSEKWVAGVETDFDGANIKGGGSAPVLMTAVPIDTLAASQKVAWFGTVRARLGYVPVNNLMVYATGGLAYGRIDESANVTISPGNAFGPPDFGFAFLCANPAVAGGGPTCFAGSQSRTSVGWTAGGGVEAEIARNLTLKVEYLYVNMGGSTFNLPTPSVDPSYSPSFLKASFGDAAFNLVRVGANWRF